MAFKSDELTQGEYVIASLRTHIKAIWKALLTLVVAILVFVVGSVFLHDKSTWAVPALGILAILIILIFVIKPVLDWYSTHFVITNKRIVTRHGVFTTNGRDIPLFRVNDVSSVQGVLDRILGCGTLVVSDASQQAGLRFQDIPGVKRIQVELTQLLLELHDGSDDDGTRFRRLDGPDAR